MLENINKSLRERSKQSPKEQPKRTTIFN